MNGAEIPSDASPTGEGLSSIRFIRKRDSQLEPFQPVKIAWAILKATKACGSYDYGLAKRLSGQVVELIETEFPLDHIPEVEEVQDLVERVLIKNGHAQTAKAYILYREKRANARNLSGLIAETQRMFSSYLGDKDWRVKENANTQRSINGLNNFLRESLIEKNWLHTIYPAEVREAHLNGDAHIHDLGFWGPYCAGWDLRQLLVQGFGGVPGKVESHPPKHLCSLLGQIVNATCTLQGECAGAQAWNNIDTYCAPFIRYDGLTYDEVKQALQEFVFNLNIPTRVGFQCPFSNLTFDLAPPPQLRSQAVIVGGRSVGAVYEDFQAEMDVFNRAFCEIMLEGDAKGRVFTFPIPTINITRDFDWGSPSVDAFMRSACKYGIPYFANYVNSDLSPEDAVSMCCRLRLDVTELRRRGGGLFGSSSLTGSIGVFTINLPRIGCLAKSEEEFKGRLREMVRIGVTSLEIKRKVIEAQTEAGLYPYSAHYLREVNQRSGQYWTNHFSTIGIVGMNEAALNLIDKDLGSPEGQRFALEILHYLRALVAEAQTETGHFYNLEATPAESTAYRLARLDKERCPDIRTAGVATPYYTNSSQLPVGYSDDIFEVLKLQDKLQALYTGGTVLHLYLGESIEDMALGKRLIRRIFGRYRLPYLSLTPTFSICPHHGYLRGEHSACPHCGAEAEVWSRITGYFRPVANFNDGKKQEFRDRLPFVLPTLPNEEA